jgi:hypothetical protein
LQAPAADQVGGAGILHHVEGVFVAHVDYAGADLDAARARANRRQQRKWRCELARKVMHTKIRPVGAEFLRSHREVDRLQQDVAGRTRRGVGRGGPVPEGQKADLLHTLFRMIV